VPIQFTQPTVGGAFGPGFVLDVRTDIVGPLPVNWHWSIEILTGPANEELVIQTAYDLDAGDQHRLRIDYGVNPLLFTVPRSQMVSDTGFVRARLVDSSLLIQDEGQIAIHPDWQTGVLYQLSQRAQASGGLSTEQAVQLAQTNAAMGFSIGGGWSDLANDLVGLVGRRIIGLELIEPDRSGEGALTRPGGPFGVNAFGIQWQLIDRPPGIGLDEGVPDRTEFDYQQLTFMRGTSQGLVPTDSRYVRDLNGQWVWGLDSPDQLDHFIMPGVTVRFWWVVLQIGT
jgi:hypothetical protein